MAKVQLKVNMILRESDPPRSKFYDRGTIVEEELIPPNLRKKRFIGAPGEVQPLYPRETRRNLAQLPEPDEEGDGGDEPTPGDDDDDDDEEEGEPVPAGEELPQPPPPRSFRRR